MLDPAIEMCISAAEEKHRVKNAWDRQLFVLNCLSYFQVTVFHLEFVE